MWKRHWNLSADPFFGLQRAFVPAKAHEEAVARLVDTVESGGRLAVVRSREGLGKTAVLAQVVEEIKGQGRRVARVVRPVDGVEMLARLAEGLGVRVPAGSSRTIAWRAIGDAVRLCRCQKIQVVLIVDDAHGLTEESDRLDLDRLTHLDPHSSAHLTVIQAFRDSDEVPSRSTDWRLAIRLAPLTCSETGLYVVTKLAAAGRTDGPFSPRAVSRLHDLTGGIPRGIDRLATLAMMAGAVRGLEVIPADVIDGVAQECETPWPGFFAA